MKLQITSIFLILCFYNANGQWDVVLDVQRTSSNPIISKAAPYLLFENNPTTGESGGVAWGVMESGAPGGDDFNPEAQFFYHRIDNEWRFFGESDPGLTIRRDGQSPDAYGEGRLRIGNSEDGSYLGIDRDDIQAWDSDQMTGTLYLNDYGGDVVIGSGSENLIFDADTDRIGVGTASPGRLLHVAGSAIVRDSLAIGKLIPDFELDVFGSCNITGELTASSDARLKKDVIPIENATETLAQLNAVSYEFKADEYPELGLSAGKRYGLIAQEVEQVLPELVKTNGYKSVNYMDIIAILIKSNQEQQQEIKKLLEAREKLLQEEQILESQITALENSISN